MASSACGEVWYKGDFQSWADIAGDESYGSKEGWERLKRLENFDSEGVPAEYAKYSKPLDQDHGKTGVIHYGVQKNVIPGMSAFLEACEESGIAITTDTNNGDPIGVSMVQTSVWKGARSSAATQLLNGPGDIGAGLQRKSNLHVKVDTPVVKILFEGKKAVGVQVKGGKKCRQPSFVCLKSN